MRHLKGLGISRWGFAQGFYSAIRLPGFPSHCGEIHQGRAVAGPPLVDPFSMSLGADVSTKAPGLFLALYIWAVFSDCWDLAPTAPGLTRQQGRRRAECSNDWGWSGDGE